MIKGDFFIHFIFIVAMALQLFFDHRLGRYQPCPMNQIVSYCQIELMFRGETGVSGEFQHIKFTHNLEQIS